MIVGLKVGYARVSTNAQDWPVQRERFADCDRIFEEKNMQNILKSLGLSRTAFAKAIC